MADIKVIPTYTLINTEIPPVDITTYFREGEFGPIYSTFINDTYRTINGVTAKVGDGIVVGSDSLPSSIDLEIDITGDLVIFGTDAEKYSIDSDGNLIYTT